MKKLYLLICALFLINLCSAQRVKYNDLYYVLTHNIGEAQEFLLAKGYEFTGVDTTDAENSMYEVNFKINQNSYKGITIQKTTFKGKYLASGFTTYDKSDYLLFKDYIKKIGFVMGENKISDTGNLSIEYNKGNLVVLISISKATNQDFDFYIISLANRKLPK